MKLRYLIPCFVAALTMFVRFNSVFRGSADHVRELL